MYSRPRVARTLAQTSRRIVNSWDEFSPLKHIIVGRPNGCCIPPDEPASKHKIPFDSDMKGQSGRRPENTVITASEEMDNFCNLLTSHGIVVDRPEPLIWDTKIETPWFKSESEFGCMPARDVLLTVGNEIVEATMSYRSRWFEHRAFRDILIDYWLQDHEFKWEAAPKPKLDDNTYKMNYLDEHETRDEEYRLEKIKNKDFVTKDWEEPLFDAADVLRLGKDLFVQHGFTTNLAGIEWLRRHFPDHRVHTLNFPGDQYPIHIDATFVPLRPGLIINNPNRALPEEQRLYFKKNGWDIIDAAQPMHTTPPPLCYSSVWLSMNCLVVDDKHIIVEASETNQIKQMKDFGFDPIPIPFRNVYAFGGGLHCSSADVRREGICEDYFPNQS